LVTMWFYRRRTGFVSSNVTTLYISHLFQDIATDWSTYVQFDNPIESLAASDPGGVLYREYTVVCGKLKNAAIRR